MAQVPMSPPRTRATEFRTKGRKDYRSGNWPEEFFYYHADAANYQAGWEAARQENQ
jgi:hypothetical protein